MKKRLLVLFVFILLLVGCTEKSADITVKDEIPDTKKSIKKDDDIKPPPLKLGSLCTGEKECNNFCKDALGQCREYCAEHPENTLCQKPFDFEMSEIATQRAISEHAQKHAPSFSSELVFDTSTETEPEFNEEKRPFGFDTNFGKCEDKPVKFDIFPLDPKVLSVVEPMGKMHTSHPIPTDHMYITDDGKGNYDVKAPADGIITNMERHFGRLGDFYDYYIAIWYSCNVSTIFIHTVDLPEEISKLTGDGWRADSNWYPTENTPAIQVKAGQVIGKSGGGFDLSVHDAGIEPKQYVVPEHYGDIMFKLYTVDPFDYFAEPVRSQVLEKNPRKVPPYGGVINYDIDGKLAGNWFLDGTVDYSGTGHKYEGKPYSYGHLAIAYDHIEPTKVQISFGSEDDIGITECRVCSFAYGVKGNSPDPADVSVDSGLVKYELTARDYVKGQPKMRNLESEVLGVFLVQMLDNRTIKTEVFPKKTANKVMRFTDNAKIYRR